MKKIQCEVCGSAVVKKIDDTTFECQSCGVQYSKEAIQKLLVEITGAVKVDHSDEIENTIKRAEQFENKGDTKKAEEYYNKALDIDAENELAQQRLEKIGEKQTFDEYYVVEAVVNPEDNVKQFLKQFAVADNIACDIYKELAIKNIYQKYHTFVFSELKLDYKWSAIACRRYYENETVYKTVYRDGRKYTEPKTERVEKIQRTPRNGTYQYQTNGLILGSKELSQSINVSDQDNKNALLDDFAALQSEKYKSYVSNRVDMQNVTKENGQYYYKGFEIDLQIDRDLYNANREKILEKADAEAIPLVVEQIGGDFFEDPHNTRYIRRSTDKYVCIPVQVIEYDYKGVSYFAISDLVSQTTSISKLYPCDSELANKKEELNAQSKKAEDAKAKLTKIGYILCAIGFAIIMLGIIFGGEAFFVITGMGTMVISLIFILSGFLQKTLKNGALVKNNAQVLNTLYNPRKLALSESYEVFFGVIDNNGSYEEAGNAVKNVLSIENTFVKLSPADEIKEFLVENSTSLSEKETLLLQKKEEYLKLKKINTISIGLTIGGLILMVLGLISIAAIDEVVGIIIMIIGMPIFALVGPILFGVNYKKIMDCEKAIQSITEE